jgi:hypothetical protein
MRIRIRRQRLITLSFSGSQKAKEAMKNQSRKRTWWDQNWKWFVPVGYLGGALLFLGFCAGVVYLVFGLVRSSDIYKKAVMQAETNHYVIEALGSPIEEGLIVRGSISVTGPSGEADLAIPISGPRGKATIYAVAKKSAGKWTFSTLGVAIKPSGERINILFSDNSNSNLDGNINADCSVPGALIHWQAAYCMWLKETDDFEQEFVQKCFRDRLDTDDKDLVSTDCEKKKYYRKKLCEMIVGQSYFQGSVYDCIKSKETIPRIVREGGI